MQKLATRVNTQKSTKNPMSSFGIIKENIELSHFHLDVIIEDNQNIYCPDGKKVLALFNSSKRIHSNDYFSASGNIGIGYHTSRSCSKSIKDLIIDLTQWFEMTKTRQK